MKETETKETEKKVQNPHDMFFRSIFANLEVSQNFLMETLPESILKTIDLKNLEL